MKQIAIQGISGSYHGIVAHHYFEGEEIEILGCKTFKDVFATMRKDSSILGVIAIENTIAGSLLQNHNLLRESETAIIEIQAPDQHCLAAIPGKASKIYVKCISPHSLMQCDDYLCCILNGL